MIRPLLSLECLRSPAGLRVNIEVRVRGVGHRTPTGYTSRAVILWVRAFDEQGQTLDLVDGPRLPPLAGEGPVEAGGLAGEPGWMYARVLEGLDGRQPVAYWHVNRVAYDTRLMPDATDRREFTFRSTARPAKVEAQLVYRRFSKYLADQKGWPENEYLLASETEHVPAEK